MQATKRLEENGPNKLTPPKDKPEWLKYLLQYTNPLLFLLIIAGILTFVAYAIQVFFILFQLPFAALLCELRFLNVSTALHAGQLSMLAV